LLVTHISLIPYIPRCKEGYGCNGFAVWSCGTGRVEPPLERICWPMLKINDADAKSFFQKGSLSRSFANKAKVII
jgi:hypothetical protein